MVGNVQRKCVSNEATQFTEAIAQNQISANYDIALPASMKACFLAAITIVAVQGLQWELWLFESATNLTADPATDRLVGFWQFGAPFAGGAGYTVTPAAGGGANALFRYHINSNLLPYLDFDAMQASVAPGNLHVRLVNRSATGKNAGNTGKLQVTFFVSSQGNQA